jgi:MYXO-CTERM domain-containing protein
VATGDLVVALNVVRSWKNVSTEQISVRTRSEGTACGFSFEPDQTYFVYAQASEKDAALPGLSVSRCGRTRLINEANADIVELGMGSVPVSTTIHDTADYDAPAQANAPSSLTTQQNKPAAGGCASCSLATGASSSPSKLTLGLGLLGLMLGPWRSWRRKR